MTSPRLSGSMLVLEESTSRDLLDANEWTWVFAADGCVG